MSFSSAPTVDHQDNLNRRRRRAVELRLAGRPLLAIRAETGLSAPTIIAAHKAFMSGGWAAVPAPGRGRIAGTGRALTPSQEAELRDAVTSGVPADAPLWNAATVRAEALRRFGVDVTERTVQRVLARWGLVPERWSDALAAAAVCQPAAVDWSRDILPAVVKRAHAERALLLWCADARAPGGVTRLLVAQTLRGAPAWLPATESNNAATYVDFLQRVHNAWPGPLAVLMHGVSLAAGPLADWIAAKPNLRVESCPVALPPMTGIGPDPFRWPAPPSLARQNPIVTSQPPPIANSDPQSTPMTSTPAAILTHLQRLESESIHILREVVAECERPVMLYSIGKDSACMLHLAKKAFWPAPPPFPLLHVDTTWKFRDMYAMRERMAKEIGMKLLVWQNPEAKKLGINPFDHGSSIHTDMWKTQGLKQALDHYGFDAAFGGARRDEEKSRAKERIFSFRSSRHRWDPKQQRPELWHLYNTRKCHGESIRVFPISNWTELDIWQYIYLESIPVVPLYFARERPVVERDGALIMVDDERMPLKPGEVPSMRTVRFRTLGCYPLSGAIESQADTLTDIIQEMLLARTSERQGRMIDHDEAASMEKKKQEGYF